MRNGIGVKAPVISDGSANYTPGISERRSGTTKHQSADIENSTQQLDAAQTICASKQYDAFGNITSQTGTWNGPFSYGGKFGYQSDSDTNLQLLGHRYCDSTTGRFLTRDPARQSRNWYCYGKSLPTRYADPSGCVVMSLEIEFGGGVGVGGGSGVAFWVDLDDPNIGGGWFDYYECGTEVGGGIGLSGSIGPAAVPMGEYCEEYFGVKGPPGALETDPGFESIGFGLGTDHWGAFSGKKFGQNLNVKQAVQAVAMGMNILQNRLEARVEGLDGGEEPSILVPTRRSILDKIISFFISENR